MSGHVGDLSRPQEEALRQFREAVAEIPNKPEEDDYYYLRWLRARKFNVKKAEEMFRNVCAILLKFLNVFSCGKLLSLSQFSTWSFGRSMVWTLS